MSWWLDWNGEGSVGRGGGTGAAADVQAAEDFLQVVLHGEEAARQNDADLLVGLAFRDPVQHLRLTRGELKTFRQERKVRGRRDGGRFRG